MTDDGNTYRLQVYCTTCDVLHAMAFSHINTALYAAYRVRCNIEGHYNTIKIEDDFGLEEDDYTWIDVTRYLESL